MDLRLGGACTDGAPRDQIGDVLRCDCVKPFDTTRQSERIEVKQYLSRKCYAFVDFEATIEHKHAREKSLYLACV